MNTIEKIEKTYNFRYPGLYKRLFNDGMLDWKYGKDWYTSVYPVLKKNPPLLLFGNDFEILDVDKIEEETEILRNEWNISPNFKLIPFGKTVGGDLYVFHFDRQDGEDIPVILLSMEEESGNVLAKNLQDFIFRQLLEIVTEVDEFSALAEDGKMHENLSNLLNTHRLYLLQNQVAILENIYGREQVEYIIKLPSGVGFPVRGLLSRTELEEVLKNEIGFEKLDDQFGYTL